MENQTMKAAFSVWDNRIAPVFDVARHVLIVETKSGHVISETRETLPDAMPVQKAVCLTELGVGVLVCGAVSRVLQDMMTTYGIQVIPFVAGDLREVISAWLADKREIDLFAMPGCCKKKRRICATQGVTGEVFNMRGRSGGGMGAGRGMGRGGRMGGPVAAGPVGYCVCPQCGHKESHQVGVPCMQMQCPKCGAAMVRE
jgi:predicted Fe-Mo cluster-binding NifX family protein